MDWQKYKRMDRQMDRWANELREGGIDEWTEGITVEYMKT